jgi:hypothetical protein
VEDGVREILEEYHSLPLDGYGRIEVRTFDISIQTSE